MAVRLFLILASTVFSQALKYRNNNIKVMLKRRGMTGGSQREYCRIRD